MAVTPAIWNPSCPITSWGILLLLFAVGTVFAFFDQDNTVSEYENRTLATLPSASFEQIINGSYTRDMESFLSDHFLGRERLIKASRILERQKAHLDMTIVDLGSTTEVIALKDRMLLSYEDNSALVNDAPMVLNEIFEYMPYGVDLYFMPIPMRIVLEAPEIQAFCSDQRADIEELTALMNPDITTVDVVQALLTSDKSLDDLYFRYEHHWTQMGAYVAAEAFFAAADLPYRSLDEYQKHTGAPFWGYLSAVNPNSDYESEQDQLVYYVLPGTDYIATTLDLSDDYPSIYETAEYMILDPARGGYASFAYYNGFPLAAIEGNPNCEHSLLVIGDSMLNAITLWFADHFKTVVAINPRDFNGDIVTILDIIDEYEITDFMILALTSNLADREFLSHYQRLLQ